jgi:hypothetical protein
MFRFSPDDYGQLSKVWTGTHPEDGSQLIVEDAIPAGFPPPFSLLLLLFVTVQAGRSSVVLSGNPESRPSQGERKESISETLRTRRSNARDPGTRVFDPENRSHGRGEGA